MQGTERPFCFDVTLSTAATLPITVPTAPTPVPSMSMEVKDVIYEVSRELNSLAIAAQRWQKRHLEESVAHSLHQISYFRKLLKPSDILSSQKTSNTSYFSVQGPWAAVILAVTPILW
ncbi:hypothetical protein EVAR_90515_1 [Eumeta japonica]|uniref:Uncharacterized protein n=1 Tax=Eumeta variegata TaxID=151549 RepID=A0A4C1XZR4_EUMVA|nr:hypothetical protein EVAR_90515_1 [Eumeta japonica]